MSVNFLNPKNWDNVTDTGRNSIVFQNRNHAYGAYVIRRDYNRNLFFALFLSVGVFLSAFIIPKIILNKSSIEPTAIPIVDAVIIPIEIKPPIQKIEEIIPEVIAKPEKKIAQQNNSQLLAKDEKVETKVIPNELILNPGKTTTPGETGTPVIDKPINTGTPIVEKAPDIPMISPEIMPAFPGGEPALFRFLQSNINYPAMARENGIKGTVIVGFVIDITGKPVNLTILKGVRGGKDLEAEAMRVIASMPNWSVGMNNNKPVSVMFSLPVKFDLRN
jgi:protein TonB